MALHMTYPFETLLRLGGFSKRSITSFPHRQSPLMRRLYKMFQKHSLPLELWFGRGIPLNPYLKGQLIEYLRKETAPLQLKLPPEDVSLGESVRDMMEFTVLRGWMKQWLAYLRWYHLKAWSPLQDFFEAPVVNRSWKIERTDPSLVRFGLLWRVYDWIGEKGLDFQVPMLESTGQCRIVLLEGGRRTLLSVICTRCLPTSCTKRGLLPKTRSRFPQRGSESEGARLSIEEAVNSGS